MYTVSNCFVRSVCWYSCRCRSAAIVNYTLIVVYSMLLVTGSQSKNVSCFCLDMAQWRSLIGQSLCNAIYCSNMGFNVYLCSRWNGHVEYIETTPYGVYLQWWTTSLKSLIYKRNSKGPRIDPWGTPQLMVPAGADQSEKLPLTFTRSLQL
jgi:hypothetical protein